MLMIDGKCVDRKEAMVSIVQYLFYSVRTPRQAKRTRNLYDRRMVYQPSIDLIEQNTLVEKFLTVITLCLFDREFIVAEIGVHIVLLSAFDTTLLCG